MKFFFVLFFILLTSCSSNKIVSIDNELNKKEEKFKDQHKINRIKPGI